jgi:glyoxylase-like metal-dependent hydrolase (beta-lactamase superfamily II)
MVGPLLMRFIMRGHRYHHPVTSGWHEVGERVFVRRYEFFDQNIGVVLGDEGVLLVDTRTTHRQADEIRAHLRELTERPVSVVVDTHGHADHAFGNHVFRPAPIWGHVRCATMVRESGERQRAGYLENLPEIADDLREVVLDPPDRSFADRATVEIDRGGRTVELRYLGRGHTDNDIVIVVRDARVLFAGDLLENGATPYFGDGFPMDWPRTVERLVDLVDGAVVPGHGDVADYAFAERQLREFRAVAAIAREVEDGAIDLETGLARSPYPADTARQPLERAMAQLRGELTGYEPPDPA